MIESISKNWIKFIHMSISCEIIYITWSTEIFETINLMGEEITKKISFSNRRGYEIDKKLSLFGYEGIALLRNYWPTLLYFRNRRISLHLFAFSWLKMLNDVKRSLSRDLALLLCTDHNFTTETGNNCQMSRK